MLKILFIILTPLFCFASWHDGNLHPFGRASKFRLFSGSANKKLAESVAKQLNVPLCEAEISKYNDGEINIQIKENVRGFDIFIVQSTCPTDVASVNDNMMELFLMIRTLKRSSARSVTAIIPYFGYARQDRKTTYRVPISASDVAMLFEMAGVDHVMAVDLHCGQIQGFFQKIPVDNLFASKIFVPYIANKSDLPNPVVVSPDAGGLERAKLFRDGLTYYGIDSDLAMIIKQRSSAGVVDEMALVGSVENADVIIIDDICDTAGTLVKAAEELKKNGARKIYACITHPIFSDPALERIKNSVIDELIVTNTIPLEHLSLPKNISQISIAPMLTKAIECTYKRESLSHLFSFSPDLDN